MEFTNRLFLIALTAAVVIAANAGLVSADNQFRAEAAVGDILFVDEQAEAALDTPQSFFYFVGGEYTMAEHLEGR